MGYSKFYIILSWCKLVWCNTRRVTERVAKKEMMVWKLYIPGGWPLTGNQAYNATLGKSDWASIKGRHDEIYQGG